MMDEKENVLVENEEELQPAEESPELEEKPLEEEAEAPAEDENLELSLDEDLSLEMEGAEEEQQEEIVAYDPLVSEDQGKYADGFPDWNLEPPLK